MTILTMPTEAEAAGLRAEIFADDVRSLGYVPSHTKAMSLNPEAYLAWDPFPRPSAPRWAFAAMNW